MRSRITVHADLAGNIWVATFHDDQEVKDLLGTDTLPTPFTLLEDGEVVRREVERNNPGARVRLVRRDGTVDDPENEGDHPPQKLEDQHGGGGLRSRGHGRRPSRRCALRNPWVSRSTRCGRPRLTG